MTILARARCRCPRIPNTTIRSAHAAAQPTDEAHAQSAAGPSNYYRRSTSSSSAGPGSKGKSPEKENEYRFPLKGRMGGEPDPFEVMAIDRQATQSEVKKQCMSSHFKEVELG
jgi:hypothetical protein